MLKAICLFLCCIKLLNAKPYDVSDQVKVWLDIQKQFYECSREIEQDLQKKTKENSDFFKLQYQMAAIYFANKRYSHGFGTAIIPKLSDMRYYLRNKIFLELKTKEIVPLFKERNIEYQQNNFSSIIEKKMKNLIHLNALNDLQYRIFEQKADDLMAGESCENINLSFEELLSVVTDDRGIYNNFLSLSYPVAGAFKAEKHKLVFYPALCSLVLSPQSGKVIFVGKCNGKKTICITNNSCVCILIGFTKGLVETGQKIHKNESIAIFETLEKKLEMLVYQGINPVNTSRYIQ